MIVVTCAGGNVGREVVKQLLQTELAFRAVGRNRMRLQRLCGHDDIPFVYFDYSDPATWAAALLNVSVLFLVVPLPYPNLIKRQTLPFISAARAAGCRHIIYLSVPAAAHNKRIPHYHVERYIAACGVDFTFLRASNFMQNFSRPGPTHDVDLRERNELFVPLGDKAQQLVDTRDIAAVAVEVMRSPAAHANKGYTLVSDSLTMQDMAVTLSAALQRPIRSADPSIPGFLWRLGRRGVPLPQLLLMGMVYRHMRKDGHGGADDTIRNLLQRPAHTFSDYVRDYRAHWQAGDIP